MAIVFKPLSQKSHYAEVKSLYYEAFPKEERAPWWLLRLQVYRGKGTFEAIYDEEQWVGLIYNIFHVDILHVMFFAIDRTTRGGGYGSKALQTLRDHYPSKRIVLEIEELLPTASNYKQRVQRKAFYEKNGFRSSGLMLQEGKQTYEVLLMGDALTAQELNTTLRKYGGWLMRLLAPVTVYEK